MMTIAKKFNRFFWLISILTIILILNQCIISISICDYRTKELMGTSYSIVIISSNNILYVGGTGPGNYTTIQDAIDNASNGDTIYVYNGTYKENIVIDKIVDLIAESQENVIIDGSNSGNTIKIKENNVSISHFTIRRGGIGIYILRSSNHTICNNKIIDNWEGIGLLRSSNTNITKNTISNNFFEGINPVESSSVIIAGNTIVGNLQGIFISKSKNSTTG